MDWAIKNLPFGNFFSFVYPFQVRACAGRGYSPPGLDSYSSVVSYLAQLLIRVLYTPLLVRQLFPCLVGIENFT